MISIDYINISINLILVTCHIHKHVTDFMRMEVFGSSLMNTVTEMSHLAKENIELNSLFWRTGRRDITFERAPSHRAFALPSALARETNGAQ